MNRAVQKKRREAAPRSRAACFFNRMQAHQRFGGSGPQVALHMRVDRERRGGPKEATMKRLTKLMAAAAVVLRVTTGTASAQAPMKAEVPFAFSVGNRVVEPGTYRVAVIFMQGSSPVLTLEKAEPRR